MIRWILGSLGVLVLVVVLLFAALFALPADRIAGLANTQIRDATGRELSLSGRLRPSFWPVLGLSTGGLSISNAPWSEAGAMLRAEGASLGLDASALLGGELRVARLRLEAPTLQLERAGDGRVNWALDAGASEPGGGDDTAGGDGAASLVAVDSARVTDGSVTYVDHGTGRRMAMTAIDASISLAEAGGALSGELSGEVAGTRAEATLDLVDTDAALTGQRSEAELSLRAGESNLRFLGLVSTAPYAAGRLSLEMPGPGAPAEALGAAAPDLPPALDGPAQLSAEVTAGADGRVELSALDAVLGEAGVTGELTLATAGARPKLTGDLDFGALPLSGGAPDGGGGQGSAGSGGWPTAPLELSPMGLADADLRLSADSVSLPETTLSNAAGRVRLEDRRLVVTINSLGAFGGGATGEVVLNARGTPSASADMTAEGMDLRPLLTDLAGVTRLTGSAAGKVDLLTSGASVDAMVRSLDGSGRIDFGQGEIIGLDLAGIVRNLDLSQVGDGKRTVYDSLTGSFTIEDGVLSNEDLRLETPLVLARGAGDVSLGPRTLDYRVTPELRASDEGEALRLPIRFSGSWDSPKVRPDLEGAAEAQLDEAADKAGDAARDRLRDEIGADDDQDTEDAVRDKIEEEVGRSLQNLLDR